MNALITIGQELFNWTWKTSIQAGVLVVLILLLQRLLGRWLTPRLRYALSLLVLCRLLLPMAPSSSLSIENLLTQNIRPAQPSGIATTVAAPLRAAPPVRARPAVFSLASTLGLIWFCGLLALLCLATWRYCEWRRFIRSATPVFDVRLLDILDEARKAMGIRRPVTLVSVSQLSSPAIFGIWQVRLLLPETALLRLTEPEWRLVFMHEMAHVRQNDALLNLVIIAVQFLHWFNPLVWVGLHQLRADRELVCDAMVLKRVNFSEHLGYAHVLLKLAEAISLGPRVFPSALPVVSGGGEIKRRILMIKHYRKRSRVAGVAIIVLIFALGSLTFTRAREGETQKIQTDNLDQLIERQLILHEFKTAGYNLPESLLDQNTIKSESGDRDEARGDLGTVPTGEQIVLRRNGAATATNGALVRFGSVVVSADRLTMDTEKGEMVADGHVRIQNGEQVWASEHLTLNLKTNQTASQFPGQDVSQVLIKYVGPPLVKEAAIRPKLHLQAGKPFSPGAVDEDVRNLYATGLFYNVRVGTESTPAGITLTYTVQCNPLLGKLKFARNSKFSDAQLRKELGSEVGGPFNERKLFQDSRAIQDMYEKAGYKGTTVKYTYETDTESGKTTVTFVITEHIMP